jgi:hypothetical protein
MRVKRQGKRQGNNTFAHLSFLPPASFPLPGASGTDCRGIGRSTDPSASTAASEQPSSTTILSCSSSLTTASGQPFPSSLEGIRRKDRHSRVRAAEFGNRSSTSLVEFSASLGKASTAVDLRKFEATHGTHARDLCTSSPACLLSVERVYAWHAFNVPVCSLTHQRTAPQLLHRQIWCVCLFFPPPP